MKLTQTSLVHAGNASRGFMSEGNEQAPISSGWWYGPKLSFLHVPLLLAVIKRGLPVSFTPPRTPPASLSPVSDTACGHLLSRLASLVGFYLSLSMVVRRSAASPTSVGTK